MRTRAIAIVVVAAVVFMSSSLLLAQAQTPKQSPPANPPAANAQPFDPHDLSAIWEMDVQARGRGTLRGMGNQRPPLTPWGQAKEAATRPSFAAKPYGKTVAPESQWNDPEMQCDPNGYPRNMFHGEIAKFVQTPSEIVQLFERDHTYRDIWIDGRKLPADPEPRYYGFAAGHWDGDTLVIDANGFNDRTWLDQYGSPHSDQMTLHETVRRTSHDNLEWVITINDPKTYTTPWVSDKLPFKLVPKSTRSENVELGEDFCVWSDQNNFFSRIDSTGVGGAVSKGYK